MEEGQLGAPSPAVCPMKPLYTSTMYTTTHYDPVVHMTGQHTYTLCSKQTLLPQ
jgi:hypothetical protein